MSIPALAVSHNLLSNKNICVQTTDFTRIMGSFESQASLKEVELANTFEDVPFSNIIAAKILDSSDSDEEEIKDAFESVDDLRSEISEDWNPRQPASDSRVWRYLNFTQLMSILERKSIWFSNISNFNDPYEGTIPRKNIEDEIQKIIDESGVDRQTAKNIHQVVTSGNKYNVNGFVNCWNKSEYESAALWEQYIEASEGVAISTSVERLERSLEDSNINLTFGEVKYINYDMARIPDGILPTFYHKRLSFQHENEYRISFIHDSEENPPVGKYVDVNVDTLIDKLYLAPTTQDWFSDQVAEVLNTYDVDCELVKSDINSDPVY